MGSIQHEGNANILVQGNESTTGTAKHKKFPIEEPRGKGQFRNESPSDIVP